MAEANKPLDPDDINYTTNTYGSGDNEETESDDELEEAIEQAPVEIKEEFIKPKKSILPKILIGIVAFLLLLLIIGLVLYFSGFFAPKEVKKVETPPIVEQPVEKVEAAENNYKFDIKDINSKKLNEQLATLTSKNLNDEKIEELEKKENEKKLVDEQKKKEEDLLKNQETELLKQKSELEQKKLELEREKIHLETMKQQALQLKEELNISNTEPTADHNTEKERNVEAINTIPKEALTDKKTEPTDNNSGFLLFINVAKIKGVLYKKYLDKIVAINPNVKLCRDDKNRIEIYFGPFENSEERTKLLTKLLDNKFNEAYELEFTQEEYDKRCNY